MIQDIRLGRAEIFPATPVEAGSFVTIALTYTADHPIDDTGFIKVCFRQVSDFGRPQFDQPAAPNYCSVRTSGDCRIVPRWDPKGHTRPWGSALLLQVSRGYLATGETVSVTFGDRSGGSPGWQMQTFVETSFEFKVLVDPIATYEFKELPASPAIAIQPGPAARSLCIAPSHVCAGTAFSYYLKSEDRWGNPVQPPDEVRHPGFAADGVQRIEATDALTGQAVVSNPIQVDSPSEGPVDSSSGAAPRWADFHGQSEETVGTNTIEDYFRFGRDYGRLDIVAHQGNDFQVTDSFWQKINDVSGQMYQPGRLVTYPGYEWSGNTPLGGDRNIYFVTEGGRISHSSTDLLPGKQTGFELSPTATDLFADLRRSPVQAFGFAHVGGRYVDMAMHDPAIECAVEIHSAWGTFEWLLDDALSRGYRVGVVANSDDHKCRPGASYPGAGEFGSLGGLTAVLASRLDRSSVHAALVARHCYATTGNRPLLSVRLNAPDGGQAMLGDVVHVTGTPLLQVAVSGTAPVESVEVRNGRQVLAVARPYTSDQLGRRIKIVWSGAEVRGRARLTRWDGQLQVKGNRILAATPVNFWNASWPLVQDGDARLAWRSSTTGGLSGVIVDLADLRAGTIQVRTLQGEFELEIGAIGLAPVRLDYGGLAKRVEVYRLPAEPTSCRDFSFALPIVDLQPGDNPIYVRVAQEDGHLAWSSPVYVIRTGVS